MPATLPYGSWPSPVTAADATASAPRIEGAAFVGEEIWWGQSLPAEGGRTTVRRRTASGRAEELLPAPWNARSRVHEYGGGAWAATPDGTLVFVDRADQRLRALEPGGEVRALTPADPAVRYGGLTVQAGRLLAIAERSGGGPVPRRSIVAVSWRDDPGVTELVAGSTFLAQPALSPDGGTLAWVAWDHPDMPWDRTQIRVGAVSNGAVPRWRVVAGGDTAALQPTWAGPDELLLIDEPTGRWNLQRVRLDGGGAAEPVAPADADTGGALWVLGARWYTSLDDGRIVAVRTDGSDELVAIGRDGAVRRLDLPASARLLVEATDGRRVLVTGAGAGAAGLWLVDPDGATTAVAGGEATDADLLPSGVPRTFDGPHGPVHAFEYPPTSPEFVGPEGELPPYVVLVHGGPTAHVGGVADGKIAFFTSRGIGVLEVNYGGSTGYGRAYRERLRGQWGVVDVDDVAAAARGLAASGAADPRRLAVEGGSAGGWTVLSALVGTDVFAAGISRYGVGDAEALAADSHDFEARYLDGLLGPLPDARALYRERSPLSRAERFRVPLLLLQGDEDPVVPPAQSEAIRDALAARGIPHAYVLYPGEGHGFRRAETLVHALSAEVAFLGQVLGFDTPGLDPVPLA
jgi:dipeptidyl aminopeptidase/acylaminoacyl peptidase